MWGSRSNHGWGGPGCRAGSVGRRISRPPARGQVGWDATFPGRAVRAAPRGYTRRADGPSKTVPLAAFPLGAVSIGGRALWWRGYFGAVAQLVAHHTGSVGVRGSSPLSSTREAAGHEGCGTCLIVLPIGSRPASCPPRARSVARGRQPGAAMAHEAGGREHVQAHRSYQAGRPRATVEDVPITVAFRSDLHC